MNKRLISFLIIVVLVIGLVPTTMAQGTSRSRYAFRG
jgi:hypothetical protein